MAPFAEREYDLTSRHLLVARIIGELIAPGGRVLDVGGAAGLTAASLPVHRVVVVDVLPEGVDVVASGAALPFKDDAFDAAVLLDVLEHVDDVTKVDVIAEASRVADVLVIAGPFDSPEVRAAEAAQRVDFEAMFDKTHPWLSEHLACGLPDLVAVAAQLEAAGFATLAFGSNPLPLWSETLLQTHVAIRVGDASETTGFRRHLLEDFLEVADSTGPSYRQVMVAAKDGSLLKRVPSLVPGSDPKAVETEVASARAVTGRVISAGLDLRDESRRDLDAGWKETLVELELARQSAADHDNELTSALDRARLGWEESVAQISILEEQLRRDSAYSGYLESRLLNSTAPWLADVAGPPVTGVPIGYPEAAADYAAWLAEQQPPDPPVDGPVFSILTPVFNPPADFLEACLRSVRRQTYEQWELVLLDVSDAPHVAPICARFASLDSRIKVIDGENLGIALNTNAAAAAASGDWFALLDHDDELADHALAAMAIAISDNPDAGFVYSDEDKLDAAGNRSAPFFKPDWSPDLLMTLNYISHLSVIRRDVWEAIGGERAGFDGAQDYDLALRATGEAASTIHVPDVLYHWRAHDDSTASDVRVKPDAHRAGRRALEDLLGPSGATIDFGPGPTSHRVRYPVHPELVSIIVPFRDRPELTTACLEAIDRYETGLPFEVLAVSNGSEEGATEAAMREWQSRWEWLRVVELDEPFNFQRLNNWAVAQTKGSMLLFLNNDTEALHPNWLEAMAEHAQRAEIGAVGARLFYPDGLIQHAGVFVGIGGFADHPWARLHPDAWTPSGPSYWVRNFLAVTAACLMIERSKFDKVGGFDERFTIGGGDVDLGIRLVEAGYRNVMTPFVRLIHKESLSRGTTVSKSDRRESKRSYGRYLTGGDPYANVNISLADTTCRLRVSSS